MLVTTHTCCLLRPRFAAFLPLLRAGRGYGGFAVAFVAVAEVCLVNLYTVAGNRVERGIVALDALDDATTHEPRRAQTGPALVRAVAQWQSVDKRLYVGHPCLHRQIGHAKHAADVGRERALAVLAVPALVAASRMPSADGTDGAAPHAGIGGRFLRARAEHVLVHDGTQGLYRPATLVGIQQCEPVPDSADQLCCFAPLAHNSTVITL